MLKKLEKKSGKIEKVFFNRIGFSAGLIRADSNNKLEKFAGNTYALEGRKLTLVGRYDNNKYGRYFSAKYVKPEFIMNPDGLTKYLAICPDAKGIGLSKAEKIIIKFGTKFEKTLLAKPELITSYANLESNSLKELQTNWKQSEGWNQVYSWLAFFDLSYFQIKSLVKSLGSECPYLLKRDPYALIELVSGIGFVRMDEIAMKLGFDKKFPGRLSGALRHTALIQLKKGHCWTEASELQKVALKILFLDANESENIIENAMTQCVENGIFSYHPLGKRKGVAIGFSRIAEYELTLSEIFKNQGSSPHIHLFKNFTQHDNINYYNKLTLNELQRKAISSALENNVSIISGGAGTGKTYTINAIVKICKSKKLLVKMAAPTGKAARRMEEFTGIRASTLHRLMGYDGSRFSHEKNNFEINSDILIVDEISMIDVELFWHLFQSINLMKTCLILVGDHNQLPPVGSGNVLRDLMVSRPIAVTILTEVMRQAGILKENSSAILKAKVAESSSESKQAWYLQNNCYEPQQVKDHILEMFNGRFEKMGFHLLQDVQVLSPTHKGPIGTTQLNLDIRRIVQKKLFDINIKEVTISELNNRPVFSFFKHDRVIQTVNNYDIDVMNGEIGYVTKIDKAGNVTVLFNYNDKPIIFKANSKELSNLHLAYCLSIHKVQGSQFPCVVSIIHKSHSFMHHRNLLYTAVTRAEKTAIIVGDKWGIQNCSAKVETTRRRTFLSFYMPAI